MWVASRAWNTLTIGEYMRLSPYRHNHNWLFDKGSSISSWYLLNRYNTGLFIMFSVITNIYNKKTKGPTLMDFFTATRKRKKFFWQLEMFDVCTTGDTAHIDTIFKLLPRTRQIIDTLYILSFFGTWNSLLYLRKSSTGWCQSEINLCENFYITFLYNIHFNMISRLEEK